MYTYIYSSLLALPKYQKFLVNLETSVNTFGLNGEICRLSDFVVLENIIRNVFRRGGEETVVVVGEDKLFFDVFNFLSQSKVVLGYVPIEESFFSELLGIRPNPEEACQTLAARLLNILDLGFVSSEDEKNKYFFLASLQSLRKTKIQFQTEDFVLKSEKPFEIVCTNICDFSNPYDGWLTLGLLRKGLFKKKWQVQTLLPFKEGFLQAEAKDEFLVDHLTKIVSPIKIKVVPRALKLIVGKNRQF